MFKSDTFVWICFVFYGFLNRCLQKCCCFLQCFLRTFSFYHTSANHRSQNISCTGITLSSFLCAHLKKAAFLCRISNIPDFFSLAYSRNNDCFRPKLRKLLCIVSDLFQVLTFRLKICFFSNKVGYLLILHD